MLASGLLCLGLTMTPLTVSSAAAEDPRRSPQEAPGTDPARSAAQSWRADLTQVDADDTAVRHTAGELRLTRAGQGVQILTPRKLDRPVNRVRAELTAQVPHGARVDVDVRGRTGEDPWTEWREAGGAATTAVLPHAVTTVQVRLTLWDPTGEVRVSGLALTADLDPGSEQMRPQSATGAYTARVFATREGLVGRTTANGHVIQDDDHFVALPSRRGLSPRGDWEYAVRVCGPVRCETAPVWDVGPWNIDDDYWNSSSVRENFWELPRGMPQAEAAYWDGHNDGLDGFGREVLNPAGIDLADGTFRNIGLRNNGWVTVTFLWTGRYGKPFSARDTDTRVHEDAHPGSPVVEDLGGPAQVTVVCQRRGGAVTARGRTSDWWSRLRDRNGFVSNLHIDHPADRLPDVPDC
ncbi:MAG TPA: hypothetical protein VFY14_11035 [Streptomyces sp.]|nr:hypothetical protein [Streptomyces sp.]